MGGNSATASPKSRNRPTSRVKKLCRPCRCLRSQPGLFTDSLRHFLLGRETHIVSDHCPQRVYHKEFSRHRLKGVLGKGVGAEEMRQKWVLFYWGKEERSKMCQKCVTDAWNTFGGEHLLDDTDLRIRAAI